MFSLKIWGNWRKVIVELKQVLKYGCGVEGRMISISEVLKVKGKVGRILVWITWEALGSKYILFIPLIV